MAGDSLARGAKSATFGPTKNVSQAKWDAIFPPDDPKPEPKGSEIGKKLKENLGEK